MMQKLVYKVRLHSWAHTHIDTSLHLLFAILLFFTYLCQWIFEQATIQ